MTFATTITSIHVETGIRIDASNLASKTTQISVFLTTEHDASHEDPSDGEPLDGFLVKSEPKHGNLIYSMPLPMNGSSSSVIIPGTDLIEGIDYTVALEVTTLDGVDEGIVQEENVRYVAPPTITNEVFGVQVGDQALFISIANENTDIDGFKIYINGKFSDAPTKFAYKTVIRDVSGEESKYILANGALGRIDSIGLLNDYTYEVSYRKYYLNGGNKIYSQMSATLAATPQAVAANPPASLAINTGKALIDQSYTVGPTDQTFVTTFEQGVPAENYPFTSYIFQINSGANAPIYALKNVDTLAGGSDLSGVTGFPDIKYVLFDADAFTYYNSFNSSLGTVYGSQVSFNTIVLDGVSTTVTIYSRNGSGTSTGALSNTFVTSGLPAKMNAPIPLTAEEFVSSTDMNRKVKLTITPPDYNGSTITSYEIQIVESAEFGGFEYMTFTPGQFTTSGPDLTIFLTQYKVDGVFVNLENGVAYNANVIAVNANGVSVQSDDSVDFVPSTIPSAPTGIVGSPLANTQSGLNSGEIRVQWDITDNRVVTSTVTNGNVVNRYMIVVTEVGVGLVGSVWYVTDMDTNFYIATGLTNGTRYTMKVYAENNNGQSAASADTAELIPSKRPSFSTNSIITESFLIASIRNTYLGLIGGNAQSFTIILDGLSGLLDNGGYPITSVAVLMTSAAGDGKSINVGVNNFATNAPFSSSNTLVITNDDYFYTMTVFPLNAVYTNTGASDGEGITGIHMTTEITNVVSGVGVSVADRTINFAWSINDFANEDEYTEGTTFDLELLVSNPTLNGDGYTITYGAFETASTSSMAIVSATVVYTKQYTELEYGWKYKLEVTVNSQQYGKDTNVNLAGVSSPSATVSAEGVPNTKPTIAVDEANETMTVIPNGSSISEVLVLSTNEDSTGVESYLSTLTAITTAFSGNIGTSAGLPAFNNYMVGGVKTAYTPVIDIDNINADQSHLTIVENGNGVTLELNGTPLGLSRPV